MNRPARGSFLSHLILALAAGRESNCPLMKRPARGSFFINLILVLTILGLVLIIALQALDLQHYVGK